jgi:hypothetical protein
MIDAEIIQPTAHTSSDATAATLFMRKLRGAGTRLQAAPFQCSVSVLSPSSTKLPTVQMASDETAETAASPSIAVPSDQPNNH